jgi:hypothetical protein
MSTAGGEEECCNQQCDEYAHENQEII